MLSLVISEDTYLITSQLWKDYYITVCRFYFWYSDKNQPCKMLLTDYSATRHESLAGAHNRRFELNLGEYDLTKDPLFTLKY